MKSLTIKLSNVNKYRLPGLGLRDYCNQWLQTLNVMVQNRLQ